MAETDHPSAAPNSPERVAAEVAQLREQFAERFQTDELREKAFDQLYQELKQYKDDFLFQSEKPLLLDLLLFHDSMNWFKEGLLKKEFSPDVVVDSFQFLIDEFLELLYRRDVVPVDAPEVFDRKMHKAVKVEETDNEAEDYKVQQVLKRGFARGDRLLRPEEVVIYRVKNRK